MLGQKTLNMLKMFPNEYRHGLRVVSDLFNSCSLNLVVDLLRFSMKLHLQTSSPLKASCTTSKAELSSLSSRPLLPQQCLPPLSFNNVVQSLSLVYILI